MTQSLTVPQAPAVDPQDADMLRKLFEDLKHDQSRLKRKPPGDLPAVNHAIGETVFEYLGEIVQEMIRQRDWVEEGFAEMEARIEEVAGGSGTQFLPEHAEKFKALAQGVDFIITTVTSNGAALAPEVKLAFDNLKALAAECLTIIEDSTLEEDDEEEEEEEEPAAPAS